jgi:hypothetical protein
MPAKNLDTPGTQSLGDRRDQVDPIEYIIRIICVGDLDQDVGRLSVLGQVCDGLRLPFSQLGIFQMKNPFPLSVNRSPYSY